jgi:hypothetical protein
MGYGEASSVIRQVLLRIETVPRMWLSGLWRWYEFLVSGFWISEFQAT